MAELDATATVTVAGSQIIVNPSPMIVKSVGTGDTVNVRWTPSNCDLVSFTWNTSPEPFAVSLAGGDFVGSYPAPTENVNWSYTIQAHKDGITLSHDPEIDNIPPNP